MSDSATTGPIRVSTDGTAGPYIMVPISQLPEVRSVLDANRLRYWVDETAISLGGKPAVTVVNLGRGADPAVVQRILDAL